MANCSGAEVKVLAELRRCTSLVALVITIGLLIFACCFGLRKLRERKRPREETSRRDKLNKADICFICSLIFLFIFSISYLSVLFISTFQVVIPSSRVGTFCDVLGFLDQITGIWVVSMLLLSSCPLLKTIVWHKSRGQETICCSCCKRTCIIYAYVAIIIALAIATTIASIAPFFTRTYNPVVGWCWISERNSHQHTAAELEQVFLWYIPFTLGFAICMVLMITATCMLLHADAVLNKDCFRGCLKKDRKKNCELFGKMLFQMIILIPLTVDIIFFAMRLSRPSGIHSRYVWGLFAVGRPAVGCLILCSVICYLQCRPKQNNNTQRENEQDQPANDIPDVTSDDAFVTVAEPASQENVNEDGNFSP